MTIIYKSDEFFKEILKKYKFVDKNKLKTATENELMALSYKTWDNIFTEYGIYRKWDEAEKKKRRMNFLKNNF